MLANLRQGDIPSIDDVKLGLVSLPILSLSSIDTRRWTGMFSTVWERPSTLCSVHMSSTLSAMV